MTKSDTVRPINSVRWHSELDAQPLFLRWLSSARITDPRGHAIGVAAFLGMLAVACSFASIDDRLAHGVSKRVIVNDLAVVLLVQPSHVRSPDVVLVRDLPSLMQMGMIAALFPLLRSTMLAIESVIPTMSRAGCLSYKRSEANAIERDVLKLSRSLSGRGSNAALVVMAIGLALLAARGYHNVGVFKRYEYVGYHVGPKSPPWATAAYNQWWANVHDAGFIAWILIATIGCYMVLVHARVVSVFSWFIWKHRNGLVLSVSPLNFDSSHGWGAPRRVIVVSACAMSWYAVGIWAFTILTTAEAAPYLVAFAIVFLNGLLLLARPVYLYSRAARQYKATRRTEFLRRHAEFEAMQKSGRAARLVEQMRATLRAEVDEVNGISDHLFGGWRLVGQIVLVVVPAAVAIVTALHVALV